MKDCPAALQMENCTILDNISGLRKQYAMPEVISPRTKAMTMAVPHMNRFVQYMKSYGFG